MKFRPCIDIHKGKVKQIVGSTLGMTVEVNFETQQSALFFAQKFAESNFSNGHICILDKSKESLELAKSVTQKFPTWQIGGGINEKTAKDFLNFGAEKVIISSALFLGDNVFSQAVFLSQSIGRENLVFDLSCRSFDGKYFVMKDGWRAKTDLEVNLENLEKLAQFCSEFLIHGVLVEGKKSGFDKDLVKILAKFKQINSIPITYAGGLKNLEDIQYFQKISKDLLDFTIGSSLEIYGGNLSLKTLQKC